MRTYCEENYQNGDKVFYKKRSVKGWKGPATVLGKEGNFVLIRHDSAFYRCHPCHLMKATQQKSPTTPDVKLVNKDNICVPCKVHKEKEYSSFDDTEDESDKKEENTSNSEIRQEVYEEEHRNKGASNTEIENQIDVEKITIKNKIHLPVVLKMQKMIKKMT